MKSWLPCGLPAVPASASASPEENLPCRPMKPCWMSSTRRALRCKNQVEGLKGNGTVILEKADELKLVLSPGVNPLIWTYFPATWFLLQPCDQGGRMNTAEVIAFIQAHPLWRLSLQTHKMLNIR